VHDIKIPNTIFIKKRSNKPINMGKEFSAICRITEQLQEELDKVKEMRDDS
jgi:GTPase Era involved in 16S rRNA processing